MKIFKQYIFFQNFCDFCHFKHVCWLLLTDFPNRRLASWSWTELFLVLFLGSSVLWIHWCEPNCKIHFFELLLAIINPKNLSKVEHYIIDPASCKVMWFQIPIIVKLRKSHNLARGWNNTNIFYSAIQSTGCFRKIDTIRILCILGTCGNIPKLFMGKLSLITILIYVCQKKGGLGKHSYLVYALR